MKVISTVERITPKKARSLRTNAHFEGQRDIIPENVARLAYEMQAGRFVPGHQIYVCVLPDGTEKTTNGNHTLEAIELSGVSQWLTVTRNPVKDLDAAGQIYAVHDVHKPRTWGDSMRGMGLGGERPWLASKFLSGIGVIEEGFVAKSKKYASRVERILKLDLYQDAVEVMTKCLKRASKLNRDMLVRAPVLGVALETARYQPELATEFWGSIAADDGLTRNMPERALLQWLRNAPKGGGSASRGEHIKASASAWNARFEGRHLIVVRPGYMEKFSLSGTPWANE